MYKFRPIGVTFSILKLLIKEILAVLQKRSCRVAVKMVLDFSSWKCKCLFNQLSFDFWNSVNDGSYETVEVVALQFNQAVLGVVVNKKEMKIA